MDPSPPPPYPQGPPPQGPPPQQIQGPPPQQIVIHVQQTGRQMLDNRVYPQYQGKKSVILGAFQIFFAVNAIICNSVGWWSYGDFTEDYEYNIFSASVSYWTAPIFLACGSVAIVAADIKTHRKIRAVMGLAVTSAILGFGLWGWGLWQTIHVSVNYDFDYYYGQVKSATAMAILIMVSGLVQVTTSIWLCSLSADLVNKGQAQVANQTPQYMVPTQQQPYVLSGAQMQVVNGVLQGNNLVAGGAYHNVPVGHTQVVTVQQGQTPDGKYNQGFVDTHQF